MANIKGPTFAKSSPHSSDEASHHDTPSTNLTAFSLDSASTATGPRPKFNMVIADVDGPHFDLNGNVGTSFNDPFVNLPTPTSTRSQLSPTADVFTPGHFIAPSVPPSYVTNNASNFASSSTQATFNGFPFTHGRAQYGAIGDHPQLSNLNQEMRSLKVNVTSGNVQHLPNFREGNMRYGTFTIDEPTTRAFMVTNLPPHTDFARAAIQFSAYAYPSVTGMTRKRNSSCTIIVKFTNYLDAKAAFANAQQDCPEWRLVRLPPKSHADNTMELPFHTNTASTNTASISNHEGEVIVSVFFNGRDNSLKAKPIFEMLQHTLSTFGDMKAFYSLPYQQGNVREIRVEYYDTLHAEDAVRSLSLTQLGSVVVSVDYHEPDVQFLKFICPSVTGRSTVPSNDPAAAFSFPGSSYLSSSGNIRGRNGRSDPSGNHNQVEMDRIQLGLDVRTTIMLRNIPNKVNQAMLKMILDETSHGDYDFMYLRIDFANNCNVGYAFINFVDALAIIPFARARAGQRWNRFNSDKVAEISYATIQGKDCLVQKFRNSSVMLECPTFRPKLYVTGNGHDAGEEEHFPPPDNPSKMRRSVENAEHVGLFRHSSCKHKHTSRKHRKSNHTVPTHVQNNHQLLPTSGLQPATMKLVDIHNPNYPFNDIGSSRLNTSEIANELRVTNANVIVSTGLFAPRQGQMYREEQRRRRSQWDRGTPGAEFEAHTQHLVDPALSAYPPSSSYPGPPFHFHNDNFHYADRVAAPSNSAAPSNWYHQDY